VAEVVALARVLDSWVTDTLGEFGPLSVRSGACLSGGVVALEPVHSAPDGLWMGRGLERAEGAIELRRV
jgi:hypothetical protein